VSATVERMREKLAALSPTQLDITDDSASHAGHAGAKSGGGHFFLTIVSEQFVGKLTLARHRMIYDALGDMMQREIHALSIKAYTAAEL
jgi:BolA family transcriptional regulator, general stress-responsive regulator